MATFYYIRWIILLCPLLFLSYCSQMSVSGGTSSRAQDDFNSCPHNCSCIFNKDAVIVNCSARSLKTVPDSLPLDTTDLLLDNNNISVVPGYAFSKLTKLRLLDLSYMMNNLLEIKNDGLRGLQTLVVLDLSQAAGLSLSCSVPFQDLTQLKTLMIKSGDWWICTDSAIRSLKNLENLTIRWRTGKLTVGLSYLKKLKTLDLTGSYINVTQSTFEVLTNLSLERLSIRGILPHAGQEEWDKFMFEPLALSNLKHLKVLDISCNTYDVEKKHGRHNIIVKWSDILNSLQNTTSLHTLIMDRAFRPMNVPYTIEPEIFAPLKHLHIKRLSLQYNDIVVLKPFLDNLRYLEYLNLDNNMISMSSNPSKNLNELFTSRLKEIHLSHQFYQIRNLKCDIVSPLFFTDIPKHISFSHHDDLLSNQNYVYGNDITVYVQLERLFLNNFAFRLSSNSFDDHVTNVLNFSLGNGKTICINNKLQLLDLSSCDIKWIPMAVSGVDHLSEFRLADNSIEYIHPKFFKLLPSLQTLLLSNNRFGLLLLKATHNFTETFSDLRNLTYLDLNDNVIFTIPQGTFSNCQKLESLKLADNAMTEIEFQFSILPKLKELDLQGNMLLGFNKTQIQELEYIASNHTFVLKLDGNRGFQCSCDYITFIKWIQTTTRKVVIPNHQNLTCTSLNGTRMFVSEVDVYKLWLDCVKTDIIIVTLTSSSVILIIVILIWHHRWTLKYWYYITKLKLHKKPANNNFEVFKEYDVYISCPKENLEWATEIRHNLEEMNLRVFFPAQHIIPGEHIYEGIVRGIDLSKKIIVCVNENFGNADNNEGYHELEMSSVRGKGFIIPIVRGLIPVNRLPRVLRHLLDNDIYIEWPNEEEDKNEFWRDLRKAINTKKGVLIEKKGCVIYYAK